MKENGCFIVNDEGNQYRFIYAGHCFLAELLFKNFLIEEKKFSETMADEIITRWK